MAKSRLDIAIDAQYQGGQAVKRAESDVKKLGTATDGAGKKFNNMLGVLEKNIVALAGVGVVAKQFYGILKEGAALDAAQGRFENLAASIDTTAETLLGKMRTATSGMMSDAELIASSSEIISLGLAKNEDDVTRLASVIGTLGLDMQQVIMTFANNSTMRLDALGLSVEDVTDKVAELEANGFQGDAFDEAVLIALEEKMTLLGDASETTAGKLDILEARFKNQVDSMKTAIMEAWIPYIDILTTYGNTVEGIIDNNLAQANSFDDLAAQYKKLSDTASGLGDNITGTADEVRDGMDKTMRAMVLSFDTYAEFEQAMRDVGLGAELMKHSFLDTDLQFEDSRKAAYEMNQALFETIKAQEAAAEASADMASETAAADSVMLGYVDTTEELTKSIEMNIGQLEQQRNALSGAADSLKDYGEEMKRTSVGLGASISIQNELENSVRRVGMTREEMAEQERIQLQLLEDEQQQINALARAYEQAANQSLRDYISTTTQLAEEIFPQLNDEFETLEENLFKQALAAGALSPDEIVQFGQALGFSNEKLNELLKGISDEQALTRFTNALAQGADVASVLADLQAYQAGMPSAGGGMYTIPNAPNLLYGGESRQTPFTDPYQYAQQLGFNSGEIPGMPSQDSYVINVNVDASSGVDGNAIASAIQQALASSGTGAGNRRRMR